MQDKSYATMKGVYYPSRGAIPVIESVTVEHRGPNTMTNTQNSSYTTTTKLNDGGYIASNATFSQTTGYPVQRSRPSYASSIKCPNVTSPLYHPNVPSHGVPPIHMMSPYYHTQYFVPQMPFTGSPTNISPHLSQYPWLKKTYPEQRTFSKTEGQRRKRTVYTKKQLFKLEKEFEESHFCSRERQAELAASLEVSELQVKVWFQNRRMRWRKQLSGCKDGINADQVEKGNVADMESITPEKFFKQDCKMSTNVENLLQEVEDIFQPLSHQMDFFNLTQTDMPPEKYVHIVSRLKTIY